MQRPRGVQRRPCCRSKHSCRRASRFTVVHKERQGGQRCALPPSRFFGTRPPPPMLLFPPKNRLRERGEGPFCLALAHHTVPGRPARRKAPLCAPGSAPMGAQWSTQQDEASACQAKAKGMGRGCIHQGHSRPASCALQTRPDGGQRLQHSPAATHPNTRDSAPQKQHSGQEFRDVHIRDGRITPWSVSIAAPQSLGVVARVSTEKEGMEMGRLRFPGRGRL